MTNPESQNLDISKGGYICCHLLEAEPDNSYRQFTGAGIAYNLLCGKCVKNLEDLPQTLREVSPEQFKEWDDYRWQGFIGQPTFSHRDSDLVFAHQLAQLHNPLPGKVLSIRARNGTDSSIWIAVLSSSEIVEIDLAGLTFHSLAQIQPETLQVSEKTILHLSPDNHMAAVVNDRESDGIVIDFSSGRVTMLLNRGDYHPEQTPFPAAFFRSNGRTLLIHGTAWNRLDISDPQTGQLLTERTPTAYHQGEPRPEHYLDYFHSLPVVSPNAEWVAEDGWIWHPEGATRIWNLRAWLTENVWESENGKSVKWWNWREYRWNASLCWINEKMLAVWGFGDDDNWMIPAVQLFDAEAGKWLRWFAGPKEGALYFDTYLFSTSAEGTDVWDIETGERLLHESDLAPQAYHRDTKQFVTALPDGLFRLSRLVNRGASD